jgi:Mlc titration factor MtfA (ptsG expression regulator)
VELTEKEMERLRHRRSVFDEYGATSPVEFMAVAVETFFEPALALRRQHREIYEILAEYFRQDPAAWDDARGLKL